MALATPELIKGRSLIWFIDNQTAVSCLVKGASRVEDLSELTLLTNLALAALGTRTWYEWVPTLQNVSDPLSRDGWEDQTVKDKVSSGEWSPLELQVPWHLLMDRLDSAQKVFTALGMLNEA